MRLKTLVAAAGTALCVGAVAMAGPEDKFLNDLPQALANAGAGDLVPVTIMLRAQAEPFDLQELRTMSKADRRDFVVGTLKHVAQTTQGGLLAQLAKAEGAGLASNVNPIWVTNLVAAEITPGLALQIAARDDVASLSLDHRVGAEVIPVLEGDADPTRSGIECGVQLMNAPTAWANGYTGGGIVVGVIDTGLCRTHPDIVNQVWINPGEIAGNNIDDDGNGFKDDIYGWNFEHNNNNIADTWGHGSHVSGTVAGDGAQGTQCGMAPDAKIQTLRFYDNIASGEPSVWNAIQYGMDNGADVLTASLGWLHQWNPQRATWRQVCENAFASGVVVVFAAGNEGSAYGIDSVRTPGDVPDMITVGATNCSMNIAGFSSRGPVTWQSIPPFNDWPYPPGKLKPTISAPGDNTTSHNLCNGYTVFSGTSMATPHVSGTVALMLQANPSLDHYEVKQILKDTAIDRGTTGPDNTYGAGFVDAWAAVQAALDAGCEADFNGDGVLNTLDVRDFLNAWASGDPRGDANGDGTINTLDVLYFLNLFSAGC